jgi:hypothetical protein
MKGALHKLAVLAALGIVSLLMAAPAEAQSGEPCVRLYYSAISWCVLGDGSVSIKNESHSVINASATGPTTTLKLAPAIPLTLADVASAAAVRASCLASKFCTRCHPGA